MGDLVQASLKPLRRLGQVKGQVGQRVQQVGALGAGPGRLGGVGRVQLGDKGEGGAVLGFEFVVGGPEAVSEGVAGLAVLGLAQDVALSAGEIGEGALVAMSLGFSLSRRPVVHALDLPRQQLSPVRAEDVVGVEGAHGLQDGFLAQVDRLGVSGVDVGAAPVVGAWPADVVGGSVAVVAGHPSLAGTPHHAAEHIGSLGLRVPVGFAAVP
ncbi:hypothetical protein [Streptomyces sp. B6B3]|uniref:hypothetical protein n=1 Tax=Streptomyces sp. B6B3 TaxID=3153570 RepID=UPI00325DC277